MKTWKLLKKELLKDKTVMAEYENLKPRYQVISQLIEARHLKNVTQQQLARMVKTKQSSIARLESGEVNPTIDFIESLARALNLRVSIQIH